MSRPAQARIDLDALRHNFAHLRELAGSARLMAVVKADGYGHGLERVAAALSEAAAFAVASLAEARRLRQAGHAQRIVMLSGPAEAADLAEMHRLELDAVIHHDSQLQWLQHDTGGAPIRVWLKVDTGMHRLGFPPARVAEVRERLSRMPGVHADVALMTHFASSDEFDNALTARQIECFGRVAESMSGERSLANSCGLLGWADARGDWVRVGGALYGLSVAAGRAGQDFGLRPVMTLSTRLIAVNRVARGERVGYSGIWQAPEDGPIGVAAIGYGDGYPRGAPSGTPVLVNGQRVPLAGRVSMDLITLDLRQAPEAHVGDEVVLWGQGLPVEEVARHAGTISYELTCGVSQRVRFNETVISVE